MILDKYVMDVKNDCNNYQLNDFNNEKIIASPCDFRHSMALPDCSNVNSGAVIEADS